MVAARLQHEGVLRIVLWCQGLTRRSRFQGKRNVSSFRGLDLKRFDLFTDRGQESGQEAGPSLAFELVARLAGPAEPGREAAWAAEIDRRARSVHADPEGGQDCQSARAEIESKLRRR